MTTPTEPTEPVEPPTTTEPAPGGDPAPSGDAPLGPAGEKALAEWKQRAKAAEKLAGEHGAKLKAFEDAQKTETEKLAERVEAAEKRATKAAQQAVAAHLRAGATGLFADPQDAVDALRDGDFLGADGEIDGEAIKAALADLAERKPHWRAEQGPRTPRPDPSQGPRPGGTVSVDDQIREAQSKGDWKTVLTLQNSKLATSRPK
jgi:hypothetical protein